MSAPADSLKSSVLRVLHLEDHPRDLELVAGWLEDEGLCCDITSVQTASEFQSALQRTPVDLIISDYKLPGFDGLKALRMARLRLPDVPFILFSGTIGEQLAIDSLKQGATDYVLKQKPQRLMAAIQHALAQAQEHAKRKEAERKIQAQAALLDKAQDAIMVWDMEGRITFWNRSAERIYGWSAAEALGQAAEQLLFREGGSQASALQSRSSGLRANSTVDTCCFPTRPRHRHLSRPAQIVIRREWIRHHGGSSGPRFVQHRSSPSLLQQSGPDWTARSGARLPRWLTHNYS